MAFSQLLTDCPALTGLLKNAAIRLVDIGGRGRAMPQLTPLAAVADYFACEPEAQEAERLRVQLCQPPLWRSATVIGEAIAQRPGEAELYLTHQPGMSSLLEPDPIVTNRVYVGPKFRVRSIVRVPTMTLDDAAERYGFQDACFLKLDTQGTELEILHSGRSLVGRSLLCVYVEACFHQFYKGQPLFAEVDASLRHHGFSLVSLDRTLLRRAGFRKGLYSQRMVAWAHCLYVREPQSIVRADRARTARDVVRLLGLTLAFQHFDLAFELLDLAAAEKLFPDAEWHRVTQEVAHTAEQQTRRLIKKVGDRGDALRKPHLRDNRNFE
jgi:FkbM family methyltransferase